MVPYGTKDIRALKSCSTLLHIRLYQKVFIWVDNPKIEDSQTDIPQRLVSVYIVISIIVGMTIQTVVPAK